MMSLWYWLISQTGSIGLIASIVGIVVFIAGIIKFLFIDLHKRQQNKRLIDEKSKQELRAYRRQFCVALLSAIHELAPEIATLREAHDDLLSRQKFFLQAGSYQRRINRLFETARERFARAGSELSIDPAGQNVMDALLVYMKAQDDYIHAIIKPISKFPTWFFKKADISTLDGLAEKANVKLTSLEEAIRLFLDSP